MSALPHYIFSLGGLRRPQKFLDIDSCLRKLAKAIIYPFDTAILAARSHLFTWVAALCDQLKALCR